MLPANAPVLAALAAAAVMVVSDAEAWASTVGAKLIERALDRAARAGAGAREGHGAAASPAALLSRRARARRVASARRVVVNSDSGACPQGQRRAPHRDGVDGARPSVPPASWSVARRMTSASSSRPPRLGVDYAVGRPGEGDGRRIRMRSRSGWTAFAALVARPAGA
jgi:hypothetical protein